MPKTLTKKLVGAVLAIADLDKQFSASAFKGRIGLDIRIIEGSLSIGKRVHLIGPSSKEKVEIVGIEMSSNLHDPSVIGILCSKPQIVALPTGSVEGWSLEEV